MTPTPYTPEDLVLLMLSWTAPEVRGTDEELERRLAACWSIAMELGIDEEVSRLLSSRGCHDL